MLKFKFTPLVCKTWYGELNKFIALQCFAGWLAEIHVPSWSCYVNSQLCEHTKVAVVADHTIEFT
jgi:hypothetical protein